MIVWELVAKELIASFYGVATPENEKIVAQVVEELKRAYEVGRLDGRHAERLKE